MKTYQIKLNHWASPATEVAESEEQARVAILKHFPTCDCCDAVTEVEWIKEI